MHFQLLSSIILISLLSISSPMEITGSLICDDPHIKDYDLLIQLFKIQLLVDERDSPLNETNRHDRDFELSSDEADNLTNPPYIRIVHFCNRSQDGCYKVIDKVSLNDTFFNETSKSYQVKLDLFEANSDEVCDEKEKAIDIFTQSINETQKFHYYFVQHLPGQNETYVTQFKWPCKVGSSSPSAFIDCCEECNPSPGSYSLNTTLDGTLTQIFCKNYVPNKDLC